MTTVIDDRYPTRTSSPSDLIHRTEPVVWTGSGQGPIPDAVVDSYDAKGFLTVDQLISPDEVLAFREELARLCADERIRADERTIVEKRSADVRSIFEVHRVSDLIAELARDARLLDRACQLLGSDVYVHQSRVNLMPGFTGRGFYWHSDFETWHAEDGMPLMRAVSVSIALTDNFPYNGGLMLMPGGHRTFVPCVGRTPDDHYKESLREQEIGVPSQRALTSLAATYGIEQFTGPAGSALMFDSNSMHGSGSNITPFPRSNIFIVYNSVDNALVEPFSGVRPRPTFVASRDFTPLC